jgi:hypothetical protein
VTAPKADKAVLTDAEMLRILRVNQSARIFTGNMDFVDAALRVLDTTAADLTAALQASREMFNALAGKDAHIASLEAKNAQLASLLDEAIAKQAETETRLVDALSAPKN